jgi:nitrate/nitrite transporter NarK
MFSLTLVLLVLARFSSPTLASLLTFAAIAPGLAFSPVADAILDRMGPTTAVKIDLAVSAILIIALSLADGVGEATTHVLFALVILFSLTSPLGSSGIRTLLPRLVPSTALDRANALDTAIYAAVDVLGPGLAGLAVTWLGPAIAMLLVTIGYAGAGVCLLGVPGLPGLSHNQGSLLR